jgi:hypothetical protein
MSGVIKTNGIVWVGHVASMSDKFWLCEKEKTSYLGEMSVHKKKIQKWMSNKCCIQDVVLIALAVGTDRLALDCSTCGHRSLSSVKGGAFVGRLRSCEVEERLC